jgi:hypothetical protein
MLICFADSLAKEINPSSLRSAKSFKNEVFILCSSTNLKVLFIFWVQAKKEKATWFYLRSSVKIRVLSLLSVKYCFSS